MKKYFNLSRYEELLKLEENGDISFLDLELLSLRASVEHQIRYKRKKDYLLLIKKYLNQIITLDEFRSKFSRMERNDSEKAAMLLENPQALEFFILAKDLDKFSDSIGEISTLCFEYDEVWDGTIEKMSENTFYSLVHDHYLQLENFK